MPIRCRPVVLLTLAVAALVAAGAVHAAEPRVALRSFGSRRLAGAQLVDRAGPQERLPMALSLRLRNQPELDALIAAQQQPDAPEYHRWLTPEEFAARFAPPAEEYDAVVDWVRAQGFAVRPFSNRLRIEFSGSVATVEHSFGVRMHHYLHRGRQVLGTADAPQLPARVATDVASVRLDTVPLALPLVRVLGPAGQLNTMGPRDMATAYNATPVLDRGVDGDGQTIAVVARSDFNMSDVILFQQNYGFRVQEPVKTFVGPNPGVGAADGVCAGIRDRFQHQLCLLGEEAEVLLDVQWAGALAPGATVMPDISGADIDTSLADIVTKHTEAKIITMSFGICERLEGGSLEIFAPMYAQAAVQGQTILISTGDDGADACQDGAAAGVNALSSDPNVTAVGGTSLNPEFDGSGAATGYESETVWNDGGGATGGGRSTLVAKPAYQHGPGVPDDGQRDQPDVAVLGSPATPGYAIVQESVPTVVGGTSVGAPVWAGIVALIDDASGNNGAGALNHAFYALARQQYAESGPAVFHDVTSGTNSFNGVTGYSAGFAYDLATGLGTPNVDALVRAFAAPTCVGDCNGDGTVTVDELVLGVTIALGTTPVSDCLALDANGDGAVTIEELIAATNRAVGGC